MKKLFSKMTVIALLLTLNASGILTIGSTLGFFNDVETLDNNLFSAGSLDFSLASDQWSPETLVSALAPGDSITRHMSILQGSSTPFQYKIKTVQMSGDVAFCNALHLVAKQEATTLYDGALMSFDLAPPVPTEGDEQDDWTFDVDLPSNSSAFDAKTCEFRFDVDGWQIGFPDGTSGFSDHEELENILESSVAIQGNDIGNFSPIADSYISQEDSTENNGNSNKLKIKSKSGEKNKRAFVHFDFHFPSGTTIQSAGLKLFMDDAPSASRIYTAARPLSSWTESGITWDNQPATSSPSATTTTGTIHDTWLSWNVKDDVSGFVAGTFSNYGWSVFDTAESSATTREAEFIARENNDEDKRPVLEVAFSATPAATSYVVVNEVYADVGSGKGSEGTNEWVELYNPTASAIDIKDWQICDATFCDTFATTSPSIMLPSHEFAVVTNSASTWTKWTLPAGAIQIVLGSNIGGGLANGGDAVILKDASSVEIDAMSYGTNVSKLNPSVPITREGDSMARVVKGYDADSADDWVINATPNPGTNPSENGEEIIRFTSKGIEIAAHQDDLPMLAPSNTIENFDPQPEEELIQEELIINVAPLIDSETVQLDSVPNEQIVATGVLNELIIELASTSVFQESLVADASSTLIILQIETPILTTIENDQMGSANTTETAHLLPAILPEEQAIIVEKPQDDVTQNGDDNPSGLSINNGEIISTPTSEPTP